MRQIERGPGLDKRVAPSAELWRVRKYQGWSLCSVLAFGCGATPRRATVPVTLTALPSDEAATAHACRFAYEVREVGRRTVEALRHAPSDRYVDHAHVEVRSGSVDYVLRLVETGDGVRARSGEPAQHREVTDGAHTVTIGESVATHSLEYPTDGHGALLMALRHDDYHLRPTLYVIDDGVVAAQMEVRNPSGFVGLTPSARGWFATQHNYRGEVVVLSLSRDGSGEEIARVGDEARPAGELRVLEGHVAVAVAYTRGSGVQLELEDADGTRRTFEVDEERGGGRLRVVDLLAVEDGWWIVVEANWDEIHYSAGPPEWRFHHLGLQGSRIGESRVRHDARGRYEGQLRIEDGELRAELRASSGDRDHDESITVAIVERGPCDAIEYATCDPRVWPGEETEEVRAWHRGWNGAAAGVSIERHDADDSVLWTTTLPGERALSGLLQLGEVVYLVTVGPGGARLRTLDANTGGPLGSVSIERSVEYACLAPRDDGVLIGLASPNGLFLHDERGAPLLTFEGDWGECHFAELPERWVLAAARVDVHTSAGPWSHVEAFVLSSDGRHQHAHHVAGLGGGGFRSIPDGDGVILTFWDRSHWNVSAWRFSRIGEPRETPRHLATLYGFPYTRLTATSLGPSLAWSRWDEHGVVPLCHAVEADEAARSGGYEGMSVTLPR